MSRLLHRVALAASGALGRAPSARPALRDLDALLTREALLLDPGGDEHRILFALVDAEDGRFQDALDALARIATGSPRPAGSSARLCAAAVCELLGRAEEADRWLANEPEDKCPLEDNSFQLALVTVTLGGAPGAVAGSQGRLAYAAFHFIDGCVRDGGMSAFRIIVTGLLKHAVKRRECSAWWPTPSASPAAPKFGPFFVVQSLQVLLSAVVLRALPLCGERVRAALRVVGRDLGRAVEGRDAPAVADLRLLQAFLAARGSYFEEALATYAEAAREDASDPRPRYLAHQLCVLAGWPDESDKWLAACKHLAAGSSLDEQVALRTLMDELAVAVALGGSALAFDDDDRFPVVMGKIVGAAGSRADAALVSALRDKNMPLAARLEARAARAFLHAGVWSALKDLKSKIGGAT
ncbi:hypothetical protein GQ55_5G292400 [Panicum hallii var. hallii]|uniref:Uncharacterized protein n=1 Tax=Panicum hallii var. hallii TaxID=1504633 RepID=A0A2T7DLC5_9POAL|nr:hypothetical protein GQ55_5G292400 [Panicum hallii var. hallii]